MYIRPRSILVRERTPPKLVRISSPLTPGKSLWSGDHGMTTLLVLLVVLVFVVPVVAHHREASLLLVDVVITLVLLTGIHATAGRRARPLLAAVALAALAIRWAAWGLPALAAPVLREGSSLATLLLLAAIVAAKVFEAGEVTLNRVMAAVVLYLLMGLSWAMIYELLAAGAPGSFAGEVHGGGGERWVYYSFVTLTTVGYGDITPVTPGARSLAILEALVGQLYPAILLGRLVSLQVEAGATGK